MRQTSPMPLWSIIRSYASNLFDAFHVLISGFWSVMVQLCLRDLAVVALVPQLATAQCPSYTSFSQVTCSIRCFRETLTRVLGASWTRICRATWAALYAACPGVSYF